MELATLVQRIRLGDREALKALIAEYGAGVYRKAYQKTQDKELAREATRKTFAQLVTTLQEQTDMDGWELWLNALAKRNIETYSFVKSDMAYLQIELENGLFAATDKPALEGAGPAAMATFWQEGPFAAQSQYAVRQPYAAQAGPTLQPPQHSASDAQSAQFACKRQSLAAATAHGIRQPASPVTGRRAGQPKLQSDRLLVAQGAETRATGTTGAVILLTAVCLLLLWLVAGVMMSLGWIPKMDLGYAVAPRVA